MADRIIIKRKANRHGGHHGGAWKVAYADFVTAMMALFIVLWLMNTSKQIQEAIGGYFKDPTGTSKLVGTDMQGAGENFFVGKQDMRKIKEELEKRVRRVTNFDKLSKQIEMTITAEGLRIEFAGRCQRYLLRTRRCETQSQRPRIANRPRSGTEPAAQPHLRRRPYRFQALPGKERLLQLGALCRPRQRCAPHHA